MSKFKAGTSNYKAPAHKGSRVRSPFTGGGVSAGVQDGLSAVSRFDSESHGPMLDNEVDSMTGNATERIKEDKKTSVSSKGNTFELC